MNKDIVKNEYAEIKKTVDFGCGLLISADAREIVEAFGTKYTTHEGLFCAVRAEAQALQNSIKILNDAFDRMKDLSQRMESEEWDYGLASPVSPAGRQAA